jgi:hypothetical protein
MNNQQIFINCVTEDRKTGELIAAQLAKSEISYFFPADDENLATTQLMVEKIDEIDTSNGIMIAVLSKNALQKPLFISNIQYMCEKAGKKRVVILYRIDDIAKENPVALYYPQAVHIRAKKNSTSDFEKIIINSKRLLGMDTPRTIIPQRLPTAKIKRWFIATAILSFLAGAIIFFWQGINQSNATTTPENTPVITSTPTQSTLFEPFSDMSINQGIKVNPLPVAFYQATESPAAIAPFTHQSRQPDKVITFTDPKFENAVDTQNFQPLFNGLINKDIFLLKQVNGVLQVSSSGQDGQNHNLSVSIPHIYQLKNLSYISIRFCLADYQGWTVEGEESYLDFFMDDLRDDRTKNLFSISPNRQNMFINDNEFFLGTKWHTLEMTIEPGMTNLDFILQYYLDGELVVTDSIQSSPEPNQAEQLGFNLRTNATTDWFSIFINEINFGLNSPSPSRQNAEDVTYHFNPDNIFYKTGFDDTSVTRYIDGSPENRWFNDGKLIISQPPWGNNQGVSVHFSTKSYSDVNYYAIKFRFTSEPDPWVSWESFNLALGNNANGYIDNPINFNIDVLNKSIAVGSPIENTGINGSPENIAVGDWHTLELLIYPKDSTFYGQYWYDDNLIVDQEVATSEPSLPMKAEFMFGIGFSSHLPYNSEIDDITLGYVSDPSVQQ